MNTLPTNMHDWSHFAIEMPINKHNQGPASVGVDAVLVKYEVWDQLCHSYGTFDTLGAAVNEAMKLTRLELANTNGYLSTGMSYAQTMDMQEEIASIEAHDIACDTKNGIILYGIRLIHQE